MPILQIVVFVLMAAVAIGFMVWHFARAHEILASWAAENGLRLVRAERRWFFKGPFFFWSSDGQVVYYVTVREHDGRLRRGYLRCGGWFLGLLSNVTSVRWDE